MEEKMKYSTRQQKMILECLQEYGDTFYTIDQFMEILRGKEIQIGRTTVYRGLERLQKEGAVLKVPSVEGAPAQYRRNRIFFRNVHLTLRSFHDRR